MMKRLLPWLPFCSLALLGAAVLMGRLTLEPKPPDDHDRLAERLRAAGLHVYPVPSYPDAFYVTSENRPYDELARLPRTPERVGAGAGAAYCEPAGEGAGVGDRIGGWRVFGDPAVCERVKAALR